MTTHAHHFDARAYGPHRHRDGRNRLHGRQAVGRKDLVPLESAVSVSFAVSREGWLRPRAKTRGATPTARTGKRGNPRAAIASGFGREARAERWHARSATHAAWIGPVRSGRSS